MILRLIRTVTSKVAMLDVHATAEDGAIGIFVLFPDMLLHPSPSQARQWDGFVHFVVSDRQPRWIEFAASKTMKIN